MSRGLGDVYKRQVSSLVKDAADSRENLIPNNSIPVEEEAILDLDGE